MSKYRVGHYPAKVNSAYYCQHMFGDGLLDCYPTFVQDASDIRGPCSRTACQEHPGVLYRVHHVHRASEHVVSNSLDKVNRLCCLGCLSIDGVPPVTTQSSSSSLWWQQILAVVHWPCHQWTTLPAAVYVVQQQEDTLSALTLLKQQISATPPGAIAAASVIWRRIQMFRLNSTQHWTLTVNYCKSENWLLCTVTI